MIGKCSAWRVAVGTGLTALLTGAIALGLGLTLVRAGLDPQAPPPASRPAAAHARAVVPFTMLASNHMTVEARINGKGPYRLIFDLGAPITLLSNRASEASGVVKADAPRSFLFSMRGEAEVEKLQVGELTATKLPVFVFDHPALKILSEALGDRLDGIIGFTFFAHYRTTIDYQASTMTFEPVDFAVRDLIRDLPDRLMGPKMAHHRVLAPQGLWGVRLAKPEGRDTSAGVPIAEVHPGSSAAVAGLKSGDVLTTIDDRWTTSIADVYAAAAAVKPGQAIRVVILRDGKEQTQTVHPADGL